MKKASFLLLTVMSLFILSCESSSETPDNHEIVDDYKLLTVNSEGGVFEIGNNTGATTKVGQIPTLYNLIMLQTVCNVGSKIYALEAIASLPGRLLVYDKTTGRTSTVQLNIPSSVTSTMFQPSICSLKYNGSELIAICGENMPNDTHPSKIVAINLQNYEVRDLDISFFQQAITSTELVNNKLYLTSLNHGILEVDLNEKTVNEKLAGRGTRLAKINTSKLALMKIVPGIVNGVKPSEYNIDNNLLSDKSSGNNFSVGNIYSNSLFYNDEYLNIIFKEAGKLAILKINYQNNEINFVNLDYNILGANATFVSIID